MHNIKGYSSALQSLKLARFISVKSKLKSTFVLNSYRVALLRHYVIRRKLVVPRKNGRLDGLAGSMVEYVNTSINKGVYYYISSYRLLKPCPSSCNNLSYNYSPRTCCTSLATVSFILVKDVIKCFLKPLFKRLINKNIKRL